MKPGQIGGTLNHTARTWNEVSWAENSSQCHRLWYRRSSGTNSTADDFCATVAVHRRFSAGGWNPRMRGEDGLDLARTNSVRSKANAY